MQSAKEILFTGTVQRGDGRGRQLGFPTANLCVESLPVGLASKGVYIARIDIDGVWLGGVVNIGNRPTFGSGEQVVEVHIIDFADDLYGQKLTVKLLDKLRDEQQFADAVELIEQIQKDVDIARKVLRVYSTKN